jgi:hypothetical protein
MTTPQMSLEQWLETPCPDGRAYYFYVQDLYKQIKTFFAERDIQFLPNETDDERFTLLARLLYNFSLKA